MKKTVSVTYTAEVELDINDNLLTDEAIEDFESYMFSVDGSIDNLFKQVALQFVDVCDMTYIEGLGECASTYRAPSEAPIKYKTKFADVECEIL